MFIALVDTSPLVSRRPARISDIDLITRDGLRIEWGRPASALRLSDTTLTLLDANGRPVATLGGPRVRHLD